MNSFRYDLTVTFYSNKYYFLWPTIGIQGKQKLGVCCTEYKNKPYGLVLNIIERLSSFGFHCNLITPGLSKSCSDCLLVIISDLAVARDIFNPKYNLNYSVYSVIYNILHIPAKIYA